MGYNSCMSLTKVEWLSLIQTLAILVGVGLTVYQIHMGVDQLQATLEQVKIGVQASSATSLGTLMNASRDLQWHIMGDSALQQLFIPGAKSKNGKPPLLTPENKVELMRGMLISHYAYAYHYYKLRQLPDASWLPMKAEMQDFFTREETRKRWEQVKSLYGDFRTFIDNDVLLRPK